MSFPLIHAVALVPHPSRSGRFVSAIDVHVSVWKEGTLKLAFTLQGNLKGLRLPPFASLRRADRLWEHSCFEVFIAGKNCPAYCEFNFSPSGEWAVYMFSDYRKLIPFMPEDVTPQFEVRRDTNLLEVDVWIPLNRLPLELKDLPMKLACSAVIEDESGDLSYWALNHPAGKPDFHHPETFALEFDRGHATVIVPLDARANR